MFVADGVEAARIAGLRGHRVVLALAVDMADRVNRREIKHVEAERGDFRHARDTIVESAVLAGDRTLAARHHLVPGARTRGFAVDGERQRVAAAEVGAKAARHGGEQHIVRQTGGVASIGKAFGCRGKHHACPLAGLKLGDEIHALSHIQRYVLTGVELEFELLAPRRELVGPGFDPVQIRARHRRRETAVPAVVGVRRHRLAAPVLRTFGAPEQRRGDHIMAFAKNIRPDVNDLAGNAFNRVLTAIDARINVFNLEARPRRVDRSQPQRATERRSAPTHAGFMPSGLLHTFLQTAVRPLGEPQEMPKVPRRIRPAAPQKEAI